MKRLSATALCLAIATAPAQAQDSEDRGLSLMERGAKLFMEGILREMAPAMDGFADLTEKMGPAFKSFAEEMGPALADVLEQVEDWSVYEPPQILPNGDIIMRRKPDEPAGPKVPDKTPKVPLEPAPQIEL